MVVIFDVRYLVDRVMFGMCRTACNYLRSFVHPTFPTTMLDSSEGEQAVSGSGEQERALANSTNVGVGRPLLRSLDYPCTARLRLRRLLAYQRRHSYQHIYDAYALLILLRLPFV